MRVSIEYAKGDLCCVRSQDEVKSEELIQGAAETRFGQMKQAECGSLQPGFFPRWMLEHGKGYRGQ